VTEAVEDAEQSVTYADRSGDAFRRLASRTTHADALHQAGRRAEAEARFREAEEMQAERQPDYPLLYSMGGFQYCDLLLAEAERAAWQTILKLETRNSELETAVASCRAGSQDQLPRGLLSRAWLRFLEGDAEAARADLDEAWEIAERGPMRLFMADIHLYGARLFHAVKPYPWTSPQEDLAAARKLIEQCGYWRRKEELEDAEEAAKNW
jgi:tetratricopeptide (TPR) repeat protein